VQGLPGSPKVAARIVQKLQADNWQLRQQLACVPGTKTIPSVSSTPATQPEPHGSLLDMPPASAASMASQPCPRCKDAEGEMRSLRTQVASLERLLASATQRAEDERISHRQLQSQHAKLLVSTYR
jgi:hypothetical protein